MQLRRSLGVILGLGAAIAACAREHEAADPPLGTSTATSLGDTATSPSDGSSEVPGPDTGAASTSDGSTGGSEGASDTTAIADLGTSPSEWPDASNTGVPDGTRLTPSGDIVVRDDGRVLEALDVTGSITVLADDVVIRNSRITSSGSAIRFEQGTNLLVERVTFDGASSMQLDAAIAAWGDITVRAVAISGFGEGVDVFGAGGVVEDSWMHDMANANGEYADGIEAWEAQGLVIRHNVIEMAEGISVVKLPLDVPVPGGNDVLVEDNLFAGGGWTVYGGYDPENANPSYTNVRFVANRFSAKFYDGCGYYGPGAFIESELSHGNVWHETGEALEL